MAEIKDRLQTASMECIKCYEVWSENNKDSKAREALQDAIHELRKVASRLEIEVAISERDEMAQKPIPIPPHRDARGRGHQGGGEMMEDSMPMQRKPQRRPFPRRDNPQGGGQSPGNTGGGSDEGNGNGNTNVAQGE
jgi:hypothetical protein